MAQIKLGKESLDFSLLSRQRFTYIRDQDKNCTLQKRSDNFVEIIQKRTRELFEIIDNFKVDVRMMMNNMNNSIKNKFFKIF